MRRVVLAGSVLVLLMGDCLMASAIGTGSERKYCSNSLSLDGENIHTERRTPLRLCCRAQDMLNSFNCSCLLSEVTDIFLVFLPQNSQDQEVLSHLEINNVKEMRFQSYNKSGWNLTYYQWELFAFYPLVGDYVTGTYTCSVVVRRNSILLVMNSSRTLYVRARSRSTNFKMPMVVVHYAYEVLAVLTALTVFSCMFVLICMCTEEDVTISEKQENLQSWMARKKYLSNKRSSGDSFSENSSNTPTVEETPGSVSTDHARTNTGWTASAFVTGAFMNDDVINQAAVALTRSKRLT